MRYLVVLLCLAVGCTPAKRGPYWEEIEYPNVSSHFFRYVNADHVSDRIWCGGTYYSPDAKKWITVVLSHHPAGNYFDTREEAFNWVQQACPSHAK